MKTKLNFKKLFKASLLYVSILMISISFSSCDFEFDIAEQGSVADLTPPSALFSANQSTGAGIDDWKIFNFSNESSSATEYIWDFGDGNTSTLKDPSNSFPGEGTYNVTLTASDKLGVVSTFSLDIEVVEPIVPVIANPTLINAEFVKLAKSSGSDCACSGWINKSVGDQGESSSGNGSDVVKFDNNEPDAIYQEFAITPNADFTIEVIVAFESSKAGSYPSVFELRVLAGAGYTNGYEPTYYSATTAFPQDDYGYASIAAVENASNNLLVKTVENPGDTSYFTYTYTFNAGANNSVALFMRGIGGPSTGGAGSDLGYNSGDEEIRIDSVTITAN